jgi:hypothetical protein
VQKVILRSILQKNNCAEAMFTCFEELTTYNKWLYISGSSKLTFGTELAFGLAVLPTQGIGF